MNEFRYNCLSFSMRDRWGTVWNAFSMSRNTEQISLPAWAFMLTAWDGNNWRKFPSLPMERFSRLVRDGVMLTVVAIFQHLHRNSSRPLALVTWLLTHRKLRHLYKVCLEDIHPWLEHCSQPAGAFHYIVVLVSIAQLVCITHHLPLCHFLKFVVNSSVFKPILFYNLYS